MQYLISALSFCDYDLEKSVEDRNVTMNQEEIINKAKELFGSFKRPLLFTLLSEDDIDPESREHYNSLKDTTRDTLSISQIGPVGYSPVPGFTCQAMAYFLPRLIEFAVRNVSDSDNDPYITRFIDSMLGGAGSNQFMLLNDQQREIIFQTLLYAKENYYEIVENECRAEDLESALNKWKKINV